MKVERLTSVYDESYTRRFHLVGVPYVNQYYTLSMTKLTALRFLLVQAVKLQWNDVVDGSTADVKLMATHGRYALVDSIKNARVCLSFILYVFDNRVNVSLLDHYLRK